MSSDQYSADVAVWSAGIATVLQVLGSNSRVVEEQTFSFIEQKRCNKKAANALFFLNQNP